MPTTRFVVIDGRLQRVRLEFAYVSEQMDTHDWDRFDEVVCGAPGLTEVTVQLDPEDEIEARDFMGRFMGALRGLSGQEKLKFVA